MSGTLRCIHVEAGIDIDDIAQPGCLQFQDIDYQPLADAAAVLDGEKLRIAFYDPDGRRGALVVTKSADSQWWRWDGNVYAPTITPSIKNTGPDGEWHGYLTKGEWVAA